MNKLDNLIWIDLEMTGLDPEKERIIEIGVVITDSNFNLVTEGLSLVLWQGEELLCAMDNWNTTHHTCSGLLDEVRKSNINEQQAEIRILEFLQQYTDSNTSPMCGNSVYQDRRFLHKYMPKLEAHFHYRNLDVSTLKILAQKLAPNLLNDMHKKSSHRAKDDILESINEMKVYLDKFIKVS
jgi:oligoribonuclease